VVLDAADDARLACLEFGIGIGIGIGIDIDVPSPLLLVLPPPLPPLRGRDGKALPPAAVKRPIMVERMVAFFLLLLLLLLLTLLDGRFGFAVLARTFPVWDAACSSGSCSGPEADGA